MVQGEKRKITYPVRRLLLLCAGLCIMAFGIAFSIKAALGTSPISSVPYVAAVISRLSVGTTTILINSIFILLQILILRKRYDWFQLLQFPAVILFGLMIDLAEYIISPIVFSGYMEQWMLCAVGILLLAFGVSLEVMANLILTPGEGLVITFCKVLPIKFGNMKVIFDTSLALLSVLLSLIFLGHLDGVREGTIISALLVGQIAKQVGKWMKKVETAWLT